MHKKICTVGIISWCDEKKYPQRFKVFQECLDAFLKFIPRDLCNTVIVDNNSSEEVRKLISGKKFFDTKIFLPENIHDVGAYAVLAKVCNNAGSEFFLPIENDYVFFRKNFLKESIDMLKRSPKSGYVRLLKFSLEKKALYDKLKARAKSKVRPNAVRMYNYISKDPLFWAGPIIDDSGNNFYINNWHWQTFGSLTSIDLWDKIFPKLNGKIPAYQHAELIMMQNYQKLGLQTLVLDGGAFEHKDPKSMYQSFDKRFFVQSSKIKFYVNNYKKFIHK